MNRTQRDAMTKLFLDPFECVQITKASLTAYATSLYFVVIIFSLIPIIIESNRGVNVSQVDRKKYNILLPEF